MALSLLFGGVEIAVSALWYGARSAYGVASYVASAQNQQSLNARLDGIERRLDMLLDERDAMRNGARFIGDDVAQVVNEINEIADDIGRSSVGSTNTNNNDQNRDSGDGGATEVIFDESREVPLQHRTITRMSYVGSHNESLIPSITIVRNDSEGESEDGEDEDGGDNGEDGGDGGDTVADSGYAADSSFIGGYAGYTHGSRHNNSDTDIHPIPKVSPVQAPIIFE